ncbi:hypothetical protein CAPTEDRAFT_154507 [Capitella teleta]|uniref:Nucleoporin Nup54 alpha-helical domain-containing protein n=1 Tax=Capitella teleta TaxID=283909 RepID=R7T384_CAPTE|nr:hypothetical protein CAPTEDRAFT_154507 [Capitella teleta]|eukprot:ELT87031.1 hypothetical protein CAPTEDRAFT_154507 [Capitella teleta]
MVTAVIRPQIYGDERDTIVAKWNQLQAFWGTGKGYFNQQGEVVEFKPDNPFCRFKAVGYNLIPGTSNADGLVAIMFNKKFEEITKVQQSVVDTMQKIVVEAVGRTVGVNKMTISVCVEGVKEVPDDKCQMLMYLQDRADTGITRRISATDASSLLNQSQSQQQLSSQLCVTNVLPWVGLSKEQLKVYLDAVPTGIDPLIWQQAKLDNPDPEKLIPVPMTGFSDLNNRLQLQEAETAIQQSRLEMITQEIASLQHRQSDMVAKIEKYKRRQLELGHRVLKVMAKQEISRKAGFAIQGEEEQLRVQLEAIQGELNAPTQFKGRLNELMSQLRMLNQLGQGQPSVSYHMTPAAQSEIKDHLKQQQQGIRHLIDIIKEDLDDLKLIEGEMGCTA